MGLLLLMLWLASPSCAMPPIFKVDARGKSGMEIGVTLGRLWQRQFPAISASIDRYLASSFSQYAFDREFERRIQAILPAISPTYRNEVEGLASVLANAKQTSLGDGLLSMQELWFFQLIPDIGRQQSCSGFGVFGQSSATGRPIVGRNMDWTTTEDLRSLQAITVYQYDRRSVVNIGFAGYLAVITGFNSDGLFAAHIDAPMGLLYPETITDRHSAVFDIRSALETSRSIQSADAALAQAQTPYSHNVLLADTRDVQVLEHPEGKPGRLRTASSPLRHDIFWDKPEQMAVVNFFALRGYWNEPLQAAKWRRFQELAIFSAQRQAQVSDVMSIMLDVAGNSSYSIFNSRSVQTMVFTPADRTLWLYTVPVSGQHPARPVMEQIKLPLSLDAQTSSFQMQAILLLLALFGVPVAGGIYYFWEIRLRRRLRISAPSLNDQKRR